MRIADRIYKVSLALLGGALLTFGVSGNVQAQGDDGLALGLPSSEESLTPGKAPGSVKDVIKRLDNATDGATLEDLNAAREAVAKLDILIDIEKRLKELDSIRNERGGVFGGGMGFGSVSSMPPLPAAVPKMDVVEPQTSSFPVVMPVAQVDVQRVVGAAGRYTATVDMNGQTKVVREGDKMSDGSFVHSISSSGLTLLKDSKKRTIQVKDIGVVVRNRP